MIKIIITIMGSVFLVACGGGGDSTITASNDTNISSSAADISTQISSDSPPIFIPPNIQIPAVPQAPPVVIAPVVARDISYPFGARMAAYNYGIHPTNVSNSQMDSIIKNDYNNWKSSLVVDVPTIPGGKAVKFNNNYITVSEGIGYGMLITVVMAGHDPQARNLFDGFLKTARTRYAYSIPNTANVGKWLMDWRLTEKGSSSDSAGGGWNAMDGDLDIAMALLMADKQWDLVEHGTINKKHFVQSAR